MNTKLILVINPGSTSTKLALFKNNACIKSQNIPISIDSLEQYDTIHSQKNIREQQIINWINKNEINIDNIDAIVGRGGLLRPMPGGTYKITKAMLHDLNTGYQGQHASNLGGIIAYNIASKYKKPSFIVDPVSVDEISEIARISGMEDIKRKSLSHALNIKAVLRKICKEYNQDFYNNNFIVAHLGGGISISPICNGKMVDVNNANEEGPFSPQRVGSLPVGALVNLAYSNKYSYSELKSKITKTGGLFGYFHTSDCKKIEDMIINGEKFAEFIFSAMAYQISKEISAMSTVLKGKVKYIVLTGGLSNNKRLVRLIKERVSFICEIKVVPGQYEMVALAEGALRILNHKEEPKIYEQEVCFND